MAAKYGIFSLSTKIDFGNTCRGEDMQCALDREPYWVGWAMEENLIELTNEAYEYYQDAVND